MLTAERDQVGETSARDDVPLVPWGVAAWAGGMVPVVAGGLAGADAGASVVPELAVIGMILRE